MALLRDGTLDHYFSFSSNNNELRRGVSLLSPSRCAVIINNITDNYCDRYRSKNNLTRLPYFKMVSQLKREYFSKNRKFFPGLPCYSCYKMIPLYSKCVTRRSSGYTKAYHYDCARRVNLI